MESVSQIYKEGHASRLDDHECLWRYVPLRTLFAYLTGSIFIPSVETLRRDDPFEGKFHFENGWFSEIMKNRFGERAGAVKDWILQELCSESEKQLIKINPGSRILETHYFDFLTKTRYAWCWFLSASESAAMWTNYGKQGVAVATTVGKLKNVIEATNRNFAFGRMRYFHLIGDEARDIDPENPEDARFLLMPHFLKRKEYDSEKEVRFVTTGPKAGYPTGIILEKVNPVDWITEIRLWPGLKTLEVDSLKEAVSKFAPTILCECSDLFGATSSTEASSSNSVEKFFEAKFFSDWKNGSDEIPPEMKEL